MRHTRFCFSQAFAFVVMFCIICSVFLIRPVNAQAATTVDSISRDGSFITESVTSGILGEPSTYFETNVQTSVAFNVGLNTNNYYILNMHLSEVVSKKFAGGQGGASVNVVPYVILNGTKYYVNEWYGLLVKGNSSNIMVLGYEISGNVWSNQNVPTVLYSVIDWNLSLSILQVSPGDIADSVIQNNINNSILEGNELQKEANETGKGILGKITDFFGSFFENIVNALKSLFIPEDGYFSDFFNRLNDYFSEKLGFLYEPIDLFINFLNAIQNSSIVASPGLTFPEIKWDDTIVIPETKVDFSIVQEKMPDLQEKIYFVTDIIMVGAVLILLEKKIDEVMHN